MAPFDFRRAVLFASALSGAFFAARGRLAAADEGATRADAALLAAAGSEPQGQRALQAAWARLASAGANDLPAILAGMKDATPVGENWIRAAVDAIAERETRLGRPLPTQALEAFVRDATQPPRGRRVAFEWLASVDKSAPERLLPEMLADQSLELRFDAVARVLAEAKKAEGDAPKKELYLKAFAAARDVGQIKACADALHELGEQVDVPAHMGYVMKWQLAGPFDNTGLAGFATEYGPERGVDLAAVYKGKNGEVRWAPHMTEDEFGKVDLKKIVADDKEVAAYALATIVASEELIGQIRATSTNATRYWVNGVQVGAFEIYHTGDDFDQYVMPIKLRRGENQILVKVCQNERRADWEQAWEFQLRLSDVLGTALAVEQK